MASCDETCAEPLRRARARGAPVLLVHVQGALPECVRVELTEWQLARHAPPAHPYPYPNPTLTLP